MPLPPSHPVAGSRPLFLTYGSPDTKVGQSWRLVLLDPHTLHSGRIGWLCQEASGIPSPGALQDASDSLAC